MECQYLLNCDCISNFQIAEYHTYFAMSSSTKSLSKIISNIFTLNVRKHHSLKNDKFYLFRNLTCLRVCYPSTNGSCVNFGMNFHSSQLKILKLRHTSSLCCFHRITQFRDLTNYNINEYSVDSKILNCFSKLTYLKSLMFPTYNYTFQNYLYFSNIKILYLRYFDGITHEGTYDLLKFVNLEKLTLFFNRRAQIKISEINIKFSNLTYLKIINNKLNFILTIILKDQHKLKYLKLNGVCFDTLRTCTSLRTLKLYNTDTNKIQIKYFNDLRYFKSEGIKNVELVNMTNLIICDIQNP